ncbi:phospholysine phosphohistidine inorganic pyrophosphate phosphatase isoform X1 [Cygnus olor]|uniref:phospholysine phosphohistidine inorganic pyrophosphate phosphatase isoform X1 n=1 Tax=Cygnus olor TaxID=8869 RepID=UPI001ADE6E83|nr:phospholysine phosphohistidine inorganic pyrophosphate phosphatase isoform X1 [Cygnus olor]
MAAQDGGAKMAAWARGVRGLLLDISGVLYDSGGGGGGAPIAGSAEAVRKIKASGLKLRFCTNETQATREKFVKKLQGLGFDISVAEVTAPAPAACRLLKERGLRPHLLVHDDLVPEFAEIDKTNPNCVVVGDAAENFSYANVNEAFRVLIGLEKPVLISLGRGRYYKETDGLKLDVGAYMKALEYACDVEAEVVGKPAKAFFESALAEMGVPPQQAIMIGDDIVNDVGGAQQCGMRAVQVRTGKYRYLTRELRETLVVAGMAERRQLGGFPGFPVSVFLLHGAWFAAGPPWCPGELPVPRDLQGPAAPLGGRPTSTSC